MRFLTTPNSSFTARKLEDDLFKFFNQYRFCQNLKCTNVVSPFFIDLPFNDFLVNSELFSCPK